MHAQGLVILLAAAWLGLGALGDAATAGQCKRGQFCEQGLGGYRLPYMEVQDVPEYGRKKRRARRFIETLTPEATGENEFDREGSDSGGLIPQSVAVNQALSVYPGGKPLRVRLLPGPSPVYEVKLRVDGQVLRVHVDAQSAQILGQ
jgi:hypothetical protein